jgi:hypothetical protein
MSSRAGRGLETTSSPSSRVFQIIVLELKININFERKRAIEWEDSEMRRRGKSTGGDMHAEEERWLIASIFTSQRPRFPVMQAPQPA